MASFQLIKSEVKPLTPQLVEAFKNLNPSPTERDLSQSRLRMLREKAEKGWLITFHWAKAKMGDAWVRVNGQHSSNMLAELNGDFPKGLHVHLDEYEVDGPEGLALLFRQFDERKSSRSSADVAGAYQNLEQLSDVAKPIGKLAVEAVNWFRREVEGTTYLRGDEQYALFHETPLHVFFRWVHSVFSIKTPELKRVPIVAAMYATFLRNEVEARKFWESVARGGPETEEEAPASVLDTWLKKQKEGEDDKLKPGDYYKGCIFAYNCHRENKSIKAIKYSFKQMLKPYAD